MSTSIGIIVYTPAGDSESFLFNNTHSTTELINKCRLETAKRHSIPSSWNNYSFAQWVNNTWVEEYIIDNSY